MDLTIAVIYVLVLLSLAFIICYKEITKPVIIAIIIATILSIIYIYFI